MNKQQSGFSLLEMMVTLAILSIVIGIVAEAVITMQQRNVTESGKVDLTQQSREFMDQIVNDIHQSGYPSIKLFDPATLANTDCRQDANVSCGLRMVSSNAIWFEGDVDGTGVSEVYIQETGTTCPCTIQRGTVSKAQFLATGATPPWYTEVDHVLNTNIFSAYNTDGGNLGLTTTQITSGFSNITDIGITLYVQAVQPDPKTNQYPTVTMTAASKITNLNSL